MKRFKQLTLKERYQIYAYMKAGYTQIQIANSLDISQSTISRELKRNSEKGKYNPELAEQLSFNRHRTKTKHLKLTRKVMNYIKDKLKLDWSPEQISGVMKLQKLSYVSHETIYKYIYNNKHHGGKLYLKLRHKNKKCHKRGNEYNSRGIIKNRVMIDKRSKVVEHKKRVGDFANSKNKCNFFKVI